MKQITFPILCLIFFITSVSAQFESDRAPVREIVFSRRSKAPKLQKLSSEMKAKLRVSKQEKAEFDEILKASKGGTLAKIWNNPCKFEKVVNAQNSDCFQDFNANLASTYNFSPDFTDFGTFSLIKGDFSAETRGLIYQAMVDLGEADLSGLDKNSEIVKKLGSFPLSVDFEMKKVSPTLNDSQYEGVTIKQKFPAALKRSYLLRSVVFNSKMMLTQNGVMVKTPQMKESFYAFQVLKINDDILTFMWKKIDSRVKTLK
jgi:hypothetical protein